MTKHKAYPSIEAYDDSILEHILTNQFEAKGIRVLEWLAPSFATQSVPVPTWQIEKLLYENGCCTLFKDKVTDEFYVLPVAIESIEYSPYGLPTKWRTVAVGIQGGRLNNITLKRENAVMIWNDDTMTPTKPFVDYCIKRMVAVERNIENNLMCLRDQIVWKVDDYNVLASKVLQEKRKQGTLNLMKVSDTAGEAVAEVTNLDVSYLGAEYSDLYNRYLNLAYAHMGLDSVQVDKKERALTDEINANNDSTSAIRDSRLQQRLRAVNDAKAIWNDLDISVRINPVLLQNDALTDDKTDDKTDTENKESSNNDR